MQPLTRYSDPPAELMGDPTGPHVEVVARAPASATVPESPLRARRLRLFLLVFLVVLASASVWNFTRPALYRARATMLIEVPQGVGFSAGSGGTDIQNLAVQSRLLLAESVLQDTLSGAAPQLPEGVSLDIDGLRRMLGVQTTPDTNLVELSAVGHDRRWLPVIVNAWTDAYLALRRTQTAGDVDTTLTRIQEEYGRLDGQKREKARELDRYRAQHNIDTMEEEGNQAPARLKAATTELNTARNEQVKAEAKLRAFEEAVARGETVVPPADQADLHQLESEAAKLRSELALLRKRYTETYLTSEPAAKEMPRKLAELEARIKEERSKGQDYLRSTLRQDVQRARRQVEQLEQQVAVLRSEGSRFTSVFSHYQTLKKDLEEIDVQHRAVEKRLLEVKAKAPDHYDQAKVLETAVTPNYPFDPDYFRDFLISVAAAGGVGLLAVLLFEFLTRRIRGEDEQLPLTGVRIFAPAAAAAPRLAAAPFGVLPAQGGAQALPMDERLSLPQGGQRELLAAEVRALAELADPATRQLIGFLMSGLTPDECADLDGAAIDLASGLLRVPGDGRLLPLSRPLHDLLEAQRPLPLWSGDPGEGVAALLGRIGLLAHDAGLAHPAEVDAAALRHTYICYLVRQGARLTEIERVIGRLPAAELARYGVYSPAGAAKPLGEIALTYPGLG